MIVSVQKELDPTAQGFVFRFVDQTKGDVLDGYIFSETIRAFVSAKGTSKRTEWKETSFLQIVLPSLA